MAALVEQHVGRLDVAMHVARCMDRIQRLAERHHDGGRPLGGQHAGEPHVRAQVVSVHVAHQQVGLAVLDARSVHGQDVRVLDGRGGARLAQEPPARPLVLDALGRDDLDGDVALEIDLTCPVDDAHSAAANRLLDPATLELRPGDQHPHMGCIADSPVPRGGIARSADAITTSVSNSRKLRAEPET